MQEFVKMDYSELTEGARNTFAPDAPFSVKVVAARALLPLMSLDLISLLYYLASDEDDRIASTARSNLKDLPDNIVVPVMRDERTSSKVLTYFGLTMVDRDAIFEAVALNKNTPDDVFAEMGRRCRNERFIDIFAGNQNRLMRFPDLIDALSKNPLTPRSTIDRMEQFYFLQTGRSYREQAAPPAEEKAPLQAEPVETPSPPDLAAEAEPTSQEIYEDADDLLGEDLPPNFRIEDLLKEDFDFDEQFAGEFLIDPETELSAEKREGLENRIRKMDVVTKMRLAMKGNVEARNILLKSPNKLIQECVLMNPKISLDEIIRIARNKSMREELIRIVAANRDWTKNYQVKLSLIYNPKTPMTMALKWLGTLTEKDLEKLGKSKQIPGMLAVSARKAFEHKRRFG